MLARRLPSSQSLPPQLGTIARYVTNRGIPFPTSASNSLRRPVSSSRLPPGGRSQSANTKDEKPSFERTGGDPRHVETREEGWHLPKENGSKHDEAEHAQSSRLEGGDSTQHENPLSWEYYLRTQAENYLPEDDMLSLLHEDEDTSSSKSNRGVNMKKSGAVVLSISGASKSLLESDFYRMAPQGQHLDGWAGSIQKVVQAHHSVTHEPLGHYFLYFTSLATAVAYKDNLKLMHKLSRHSLPDAWKHAAKVEKDLPLSDATETALANLRAFTLAPPSSLLRVRMYTAETVRDAIRDMKGKEKAKIKITGRVRDPDDVKRISDAEKVLQELETLNAEADAEAEVKPDHHRVLLRVEGSKTTPGAIRAAIDADGRARNLAWRLDPERDAVVPLDVSASIVKFSTLDEEDPREDDMVPVETAFTRFIVSFAEAAEARRFIRGWHKRELTDDRTDRVMILNALLLW